MIKSIYSNLLPKAVLLSVFLSPGYVISKAHANTDSISGIEQTNGKLSGRVIDAKGEPIPGANISVKGTTIGTITDMDGNFSIDVNPNQILTISFIGYETKTIPVSNQKTLNVVLQETVNQLDELVVVSYGTQKKRDLTGSVSKIDAGELESFPVGQFAQKLQGQVAGVQINQSTGQPGKGMGFRIRGAASINGGSSPLFVVDGIPINMDLSSINPDEIETFSILKDAAATSLYGSRAANGVVLITTKRGKQGKTQVDVNASFGIQTLKGLKTPDVMNGEEFAQYKKEYYEDAARYEGYTGGVPEQYQNPSQYGTGTNWYDLLTRNAATQNYSISVTANKDKFNTAIVLGYFRQDGVMYNSNFERYSLRANNDYQVNDRLKLGLNIAPTLQIKNNQNTDGGWQILSAAFLADPTVNPYDENGEPILSLNSPGMFPQPNWIRVLHEKTSKTQDLALLSNAFAELDIWNGIKYKFQAGFDLGAKNYRDFTPSTAGGAMFTAPPQKASGQYNTNFHYSWTIEMMYDYYNKKVDGLLYQVDIPRASGFSNIYSNIGDYKAWGHEITLQSRNLVGDFKWTTNLNIAFNRNEITKMGTNNTPKGGYSNQEDFNRLAVGEPIGIFMGYVFDGVYMTEEEFNSQPKHASSEIGTVRMKDVSGPNGVPDGIIDNNDRVKIGDPNPDFIYGMTNEFSWKNFDLSILISGQVGGDIINSNYEHTLNIDGCFNVLKQVANRWRSPENPGDGQVPRTKAGTTELFRFNNSSWVYDASYLTIKNITLGYTIPIKPSQYLSKLRVYVTAQQLVTFTKYPGMNPEIAMNEDMGWNGLGVDRTTYPVPRTFSIGCNISF